MFTIAPITRAAFVDNAFIFGGFSSSTAVNTIRRFNGQVSTTDSATMASTVANACATASSGNCFHFAGQNGSNAIQRYNGVTRTTDSANFNAFSVNGIQNQTASTIGVDMFIFGGINASSAQFANIWSYNGTTLSSIANLPSTQRDASSARVGSNIFIFGGYDAAAITSNIIRFNGMTATTDAATLGVSIANTCAATLNDIAFIFGGQQASGTRNNTIIRFNGTTRSTDSATLASATDRMTASLAGPVNSQAIFLFGGLTPSEVSIIQRYDGTTRTTTGATTSPLANASSATINVLSHI